MSAIDVVVPCYNYGRYLSCCVESILQQQDVDVRILIIDDASSDDTEAVARALALQDGRVTFIRHSLNRGNIKTYNEGIDWATADYFLLLSADDYLLPGALTRAMKVLRDNPNVTLIHGNAAVAKGDNVPAPPKLHSVSGRCQVISGQSFIEDACGDSSNNHVWTPTAIVRTKLQKDLGGYRLDLPHAGDLHLWLRLACRGSVAKLDAYQAVYRTHDANMHYAFGNLKNLNQHLRAFDSVFEEDGEMIENSELLQRMYRKNLAIASVRILQRDLLAGGQDERYQAECLTFAATVAPEVKKTFAWMQMQFLMALGPEFSSAIKPLLRAPLRAFRRGMRVLRPTT